MGELGEMGEMGETHTGRGGGMEEAGGAGGGGRRPSFFLGRIVYNRESHEGGLDAASVFRPTEIPHELFSQIMPLLPHTVPCYYSKYPPRYPRCRSTVLATFVY